MKKIILLMAMSFSLFITQCTDDKKEDDNINASDVPASVKTAFSEKYAAATDIQWENAHENNEKTYKAKFMWNGKKMEAEFDGSGTFIKGNEKE